MPAADNYDLDIATELLGIVSGRLKTAPRVSHIPSTKPLDRLSLARSQRTIAQRRPKWFDVFSLKFSDLGANLCSLFRRDVGPTLESYERVRTAPQEADGSLQFFDQIGRERHKFIGILIRSVVHGIFQN